MSRRYLYGLGLSSFVLIGALQAMYGPSFPHLQARYQVPPTQLGLTVSFHFLSAIAATLFTGAYLEKLGYHRLLTGASVLLAAGSLGMALSPGWWLIPLSASVIGLGFGGVNMGFTLLFGENLKEHSAAGMNLLSAMLGLGSFLGPLIITLFVAWNPSYAFFIPALFSIALIFLAPRLPTPASGVTQNSTPRLSLSWVAVGFILLFFIYVGSESGTGTWETTHLTPVLGDTRAALVTSLFWAAVMAGRLVTAPISLRARPSQIVLVAVFAATGCFALSHIPAIAPYAYILAGLSLAPIFPTSLAWLRQVLPGNATRLTSLVLVSAGLGGVAFPPLIGILIQANSITVIPTALTLITLGCASLVVFLWFRINSE